MKKWGWPILLFGLGIIIKNFSTANKSKILSPLVKKLAFSSDQSPNRFYDQYNFENLAKREYLGSQIALEKILIKEERYKSYLFSYLSDGQKITGQLNQPQKEGKLPVVILLRGYADKEIYFTGLGTRKAAGVFAQNGFLTLAPDFLGFGGSDEETTDILLNRFQRPIEVLNLVASLKTLAEADLNQLFFWGHSNGGQILLSVLEISGLPSPSTLWAPVSESFPECILNYIDKENPSLENQKVLDALDNFQKYYEPKSYSTTNYYQKIKAPLQIHQGGADPWVPSEWQKRLIAELEKLGKKVNYYYYPQADHNLEPDWETVIERDLQFFQSFLD